MALESITSIHACWKDNLIELLNLYKCFCAFKVGEKPRGMHGGVLLLSRQAHSHTVHGGFSGKSGRHGGSEAEWTPGGAESTAGMESAYAFPLLKTDLEFRVV